MDKARGRRGLNPFVLSKPVLPVCFTWLSFVPVFAFVVVVDFEIVKKLTQGSSEWAAMYAKATKSFEVNNLAGQAEFSFHEREQEGGDQWEHYELWQLHSTF